MILVYDEMNESLFEDGNNYAFSKSLKKKVESKSARDKMPANWFIDSKNKKFPYVNPNTKKPDCRLIKAAMVRSGGGNKAHKKFPQIHSKAVSLWNKYCAKKSKSKQESDMSLESTFNELMEATTSVEALIENDSMLMEMGAFGTGSRYSSLDNYIDLETEMLDVDLDMMQLEAELSAIENDILL